MITREDVLLDLSDIVSLQGSETTAVCWYTDKPFEETTGKPVEPSVCATGPMCIVGRWLFRRGLSISQLQYLDDNGLGHYLGVLKDIHTLPFALPSATDDANATLLLAQRVQDMGGTWGEALKFANSFKFPRPTLVPDMFAFQGVAYAADEVFEKLTMTYAQYVA